MIALKSKQKQRTLNADWLRCMWLLNSVIIQPMRELLHEMSQATAKN